MWIWFGIVHGILLLYIVFSHNVCILRLDEGQNYTIKKKKLYYACTYHECMALWWIFHVRLCCIGIMAKAKGTIKRIPTCIGNNIRSGGKYLSKITRQWWKLKPQQSFYIYWSIGCSKFSIYTCTYIRSTSCRSINRLKAFTNFDYIARRFPHIERLPNVGDIT